MTAEKSYDSLPNFTAADTMRLLGIGRNQYIELMNQNRCNKRLFRRNKTIRELLPSKPVQIPIEPWWLICSGNILESDAKVNFIFCLLGTFLVRDLSWISTFKKHCNFYGFKDNSCELGVEFKPE